MSAAKLKLYVKLGVTKVGEKMECIVKLHLISFHLSYLCEGGELLYKSGKSIKNERLTVNGIAKEGESVDLELIKELKEEDALIKTVVVLIDLYIRVFVLFEEDGVDLNESCLKLSKSYAELINKCRVDRAVGNAGKIGDMIVEELTYGSLVILGRRELIVLRYLGDYRCSEYRTDVISELLYRIVVLYDIVKERVLGSLVSRTVLQRNVNVEDIVHNMLDEIDGIAWGISANDISLDVVEYYVSTEIDDKLDQIPFRDLLDFIQRIDIIRIQSHEHVVA